MALFRYFKEDSSKLPSHDNEKKRGQYGSTPPKQKAMIGKRAAEHGVISAVRHFAKKFPNLKDNTVRDWRNAYRLELKKRVRQESVDDISITELPPKKRGRPLLLGEELDKLIYPDSERAALL